MHKLKFNLHVLTIIAKCGYQHFQPLINYNLVKMCMLEYANPLYLRIENDTYSFVAHFIKCTNMLRIKLCQQSKPSSYVLFDYIRFYRCDLIALQQLNKKFTLFIFDVGK